MVKTKLQSTPQSKYKDLAYDPDSIYIMNMQAVLTVMSPLESSSSHSAVHDLSSASSVPGTTQGTLTGDSES